MLRPSAICSGMLAPAMSSTTATKRPNLRYRNRPMITAMASTASSVLWLTPSVSSTYSCGRLASTAVIVMRPIRISSRMRSFVRKSSFSFSSAIPFPLGSSPDWPHSAGLAPGLQAKIRRMSKAFVKDDADEADELERLKPRPLPPGRKKLHYPRGLRAPAGGEKAAARSRAARSGEDRGLGRIARRPLGERRLHLRQAAAARDRPARALPDQAAGGGRDRATRPGRDTDQVFFGAHVQA